MPPSAKGPKTTPAKTNPTISEILKCLKILPNSIAGKTKNNIPTIVGITSNSVTTLLTKLLT
jgi:hypothetical protein